MKNIAIVGYLYSIGGTERSLIDFLNSIPRDRYIVTLFVLGDIGEFSNQIPSWIKIERIHPSSSKIKLSRQIKSLQFVDGFRTILCAMKRAIDLKTGGSYYSYFQYHLLMNLYDDIDEYYDFVISWALPRSVENLFAVEKIKAKERVLWIHLDVTKYEGIQALKKIYYQYDRIVCVSRYCKNAFDSLFPELAYKSYVLYNIIDIERIRLLANEYSGIRNEKYINMITCGRLSKGKNPKYAIAISLKLLESGIKNFKWYFVGTGELLQDFKREIHDNALEKNIILLDKQLNPYKYISDCDLLVQMSEYESFCLSLAEAQVLGVPCISTNFPSASEIVEDGSTGYIVDNNVDSLYEAISMLLRNKYFLDRISGNVSRSKLNAVGSFSSFEKMMDNLS